MSEQEDLRREIEALRSRVQVVEDIEAVKKLTAQYMQAMHDSRWDDAVACFADEASYDHGGLGYYATKRDIITFYTEFVPKFEAGGGWAMDRLANPVIEIDGDSATGRWFLLTMLIDPDSQEAAWAIAVLEYEYVRERGQWKFKKNRCITEHSMVPYSTGWGKSALSQISNLETAEYSPYMDKWRAQGGKQRPSKLTRSTRGWTVPALECMSSAEAGQIDLKE